MALDGTLWVEDGVPYMIFCHEWIQITDGRAGLSCEVASWADGGEYQSPCEGEAGEACRHLGSGSNVSGGACRKGSAKSSLLVKQIDDFGD
jgi:hypothetical protein